MIFRYLLVPSLVVTALGLIVLVLPAGFVPDAMLRIARVLALSAALVACILLVPVWRLARHQVHALALTAMHVAQGRKVSTMSVASSLFQLRPLRRLQIAMNAVVRRTQDTQLRVNRLAFFDPLTGLANRECFRRRAQAFLDGAKPGNEAALLLVDLDGFKTINASMGHDAGDDILGQAGARLRELVGGDGVSPSQSILDNCRADPTVARIGGDVFGVFLPHIGTSAASSLAERARRRLGIPFPRGTATMQIGVSIGVASVPNDSLDFSGLLKAAEIAMHSAKRGGKNRVCVAGADDGGDGLGRTAALCIDAYSDASRLRFVPVFQASDMAFAGIEALICATPQTGDAGTPDDRCEMLDEIGLLCRAYQEAFECVVEAMTKVSRQAVSPGRVSLRVPVALLLDEAFTLRVLDLLPLPFDLSLIIYDNPKHRFAKTDAGWAIDRLADAGVDFVLENFGSEQGTLTSLLEFAPHFVRFDQRLTRAVAQSDALANLSGSLARMAHAADVGVIAQGVETRAEVACLNRLGFDYLQGPYFGAPLTVDELDEFLRKTVYERRSEGLQKLQESGA
ncbi:MAG: diguanylate cyclase [Pseudomonadota bacterium]